MIAISGMTHHYFLTGKGPIEFITQVNPTPCTLVYTLHPASTPYTLYTLHPTPHPLPTPYTLRPTPSTLP